MWCISYTLRYIQPDRFDLLEEVNVAPKTALKVIPAVRFPVQQKPCPGYLYTPPVICEPLFFFFFFENIKKRGAALLLVELYITNNSENKFVVALEREREKKNTYTISNVERILFVKIKGGAAAVVNPTQKKGGTDNKVTLSTLIIHFTPSVESSLATQWICASYAPRPILVFSLSLSYSLSVFGGSLYNKKLAEVFFFSYSFLSIVVRSPSTKNKKSQECSTTIVSYVSCVLVEILAQSRDLL